MDIFCQLIVAFILGMLISNMINDFDKNIIEGWMTRGPIESCSCLNMWGSCYMSTSCPCNRSCR